MGILLLVKWLKFLCLLTAFFVRSLIFGACLVLGSDEMEEFTFAKPHVHAADSTLALCSCFTIIWFQIFHSSNISLMPIVP